MRYPLVFYVGNLPDGIGGQTIGPVVRIAEKYRYDEGIFRHELEHVRQGLALLFLPHALLYRFVRRYRLWAEARAYSIQMRYPDRNGECLTLALAAYRLALPVYDLGITQEKARIALMTHLARWFSR